jgi:hypothetical protein
LLAENKPLKAQIDLLKTIGHTSTSSKDTIPLIVTPSQDSAGTNLAKEVVPSSEPTSPLTDPSLSDCIDPPPQDFSRSSTLVLATIESYGIAADPLVIAPL